MLQRLIVEGGPVEKTQVALWLLSAGVTLAVAVRRRGVRERVFAAWLALIAVLAALRETDAHVLLNPEYAGALGVRYRIDWWLGAETPVPIRLLWAGVGVVLIIGMVAPLAIARPRVWTLLRGRDAASITFCCAGLLLLAGYANDDLIGRGLIVPPIYTKVIEESLELLGALAFLIASALLMRRSLSTRERLAAARL